MRVLHGRDDIQHALQDDRRRADGIDLVDDVLGIELQQGRGFTLIDLEAATDYLLVGVVQPVLISFKPS